MGSLMWLLQWPIRAIALLAAVVIGLLGLDVDFTRAAALITAAPMA